MLSDLKHLLDFLPRQVDVELVEELQDLADAQAAVAVLIGLGEGLLQPPDDAAGQGKKPKKKHDQPRGSQRRRAERILVSGALPLGQTVLVADAGHQVLQARDPGPRLLSGSGHQVQGLHVFSVVEGEAAVGVKAAVGVALEDLRLLALTHLPDGVDGNYRSKQTN